MNAPATPLGTAAHTTSGGESAGGRAAILSSASSGGAGIAANRLCDALNTHADWNADFIDAKVLGEKLPDDVAPQKSFSNRSISDTHFTVEYPGYTRGWLVEMLRGYDLVNVHWASYLVSLGELHALATGGKPMLFTMHDFHYVTGGCHYPAGCTKLMSDCVVCPQVDTRQVSFLQMRTNLGIKREIFACPNVHLLAPSHYLRNRAVSTGIVPHERAHVLRNPYQPTGPATPRKPTRQLRVLLIADSLTEGRKKMVLAINSLGLFARECRRRNLDIDMTLDVVGHVDPALDEYLNSLGVNHVLHGRITDHAALSAIIAQAELMLTCSNEDNWPNILVEAGAYGCMPIVGPGHGCEEFVRAYRFGQIARDYTVDAFTDALITAAQQRDSALSARALAEIRADHDPAVIAGHYQGLASRIVAESRALAR